MSRTRIVKGTYNKITEEDHNMYSQESIVSRALKWFTEKGEAKGVSFNEPDSPPLEQLIQLIVQFRPNKNWKGEFGFDWVRLDDTKLFNDNSFKDVVAYQYFDSTYKKLVDNSQSTYVNKYDGVFKADETMFNTLKREYKPFSIPWKTHKDKAGKEVAEEYYVPWLSLKKDKEAKITFFAEIKDEADYLEFTKSDYFTFTPNKIEIKGKKKVSLNDFEVIIKCIKEFTADQTIELKAFKDDKGTTVEAIVGRVNVWANDATKHKKKDVVFVEIRTPAISSKKEEKPNATLEKSRINQYLEQAYIQLSDSSIIVELDLTAEKDFNNFITNSEIDSGKSSGGKSLVSYLKNKLEKTYPGKYNKHFKAFYFDENGYNPAGGNVSGYSSPGADYVVVFKSKNDQTAAHEFLHAMNLPHTFTNKKTTSDALFTYEFKKTDNLLDYSHRLGSGNNSNRCSLFYWEWKQANNSIK
ncbi:MULTISPECIES: hypothetical protein [unclassified Chryseobacterium]|uniref:hypothetical protein n=1 Tax=unclassified Chryseobacterium TaxID=2593645 RepID=UPI00100B7FD8|nr:MULTISPECIES: hypothetical protein [unclassified Chryseobacterium]RXM50198.1 hypothetical protein BOQ64_19025 [Chryseobacterium sp. CH25]RXM62610.1 hypothetical protein BOQ60_21195 [Chryseobacterium sp. CH1]